MSGSTHIDTLLSEEFREVVARNRGRDPLEVALDRRVPWAAEVATQLKYLKRAEQKLPSYAEALCYLPPRAFEQSSSEQTARAKGLHGGRVLDLTCGLGVDTLALSQRFDEVVSLERDPELAAITRENLRRLGAHNVTLHNTSAETFLASCEEHFDWVMVDPDRRDAQGRRQVRLEECSPNLLALWPHIERVAKRVCMKLSPLFDVDEAFRLFPESRVRALSVGDECKELLIYTGAERPMVEAVALSRGEYVVARDELQAPAPIGEFEPTRYRYLVIPDVALQKVRLVQHHLARYGFVASEHGYAFLEAPREEVLGRIFEIERIEPYDPKGLKRTLKGRKAELLKRDFPLTMEQIRRATGLREGSDLRLAFTRIAERNWTLYLKEQWQR